MKTMLKKWLKPLLPDVVIQAPKNYRKWKKLQQIKGDKVICSVCGSRFKYFKSYGVVSRPNAKCHHCGSLERHRLIWHYLDKHKSLKATDSIKLLHFAPEPIFYERLVQMQKIDYVPCDLMPELYPFDGAVPVLKADITNIPHNEESFDVILCNHVLEHIVDDHLAMSELFRVMKKGGFGIFMVPMSNNEKTFEDFSITDPNEREIAFGQYDHVRIYGYDYVKRLEKVGFQVDKDAFNYVSTFSSEDQFKLGFEKNDRLILCRKP